MGARTKTVGGGTATGVAQDWNGLLRGMMQTGSMGQLAPTQTPQFGNNFSGMIDRMQWQKQQGTTPTPIQQAQGQTGLFQNAINSALQGNIGDTSNINQYASALSAMNQGVQNGPMSVSPTNAQMVQGVPGQAGISAPNLSAPGSIDISAIVNQLMSGGGLGNLGQYQMGSFENDPNAQAIQQLVQRQNDRNVGDMRERFGMANSSMGSGAAQAESMLRAEVAPQMTAALGDLFRQNEALRQSAYGLNLQGLGQGMNNVANAGQLSLSAQGQNAANQMGMNELQMQQYQLALNDLMQRAGLNANIASGNADRGLQAQGMDQNNQLQAQQLYQQLLGQTGQLGLGAGELGMQQLGMQQQAQQNMLQMLFSQLGMANQLGTPQAQTVQTPGAFGQIVGGLTGLAGMAAPFMPQGGIGALFGGGGAQIPQIAPINIPNIQMPQYTIPQPWRVG